MKWRNASLAWIVRKVKLMDAPMSREPNWINLPPQFYYLIEATKILAVHCGQEDEYYPTDEEAALMERIAAEVRSKGGFEPILDWVIDHEEFFIVGQVLALIEMAGYRSSVPGA